MDVSKLEQVAGEAAQKLMQAVEKYGPSATDLVLGAGRVAAAQTILGGVVALVIAYGFYRIAWWGRREFVAATSDPVRRAKDEEVVPGILGIFSGVGCFFAVVIAAVQLCDLMAWVGMFRPDIYLAMKLLKL